MNFAKHAYQLAQKLGDCFELECRSVTGTFCIAMPPCSDIYLSGNGDRAGDVVMVRSPEFQGLGCAGREYAVSDAPRSGPGKALAH